MMSNSKSSKSSFNLNRSFGQKKRKTNEMYSRPLPDQIIRRIVNDLPLIQKLDLQSVNKQFKTCIDQILAEEESIQFVGTYGKDLDIFVNNFNKNQIDLNKIGINFDDNNYCLFQLLSKFGQLKRIEFDNNIRINNRMLKWIFKRFPDLSSLSLMDYRCNYLTFDWMAIPEQLSEKLVSLQIECRLNQHIFGQILADLVAKLDRLEDLTIVCPRRGLAKVFAAFGPNLIKLRITYCLGLYFDEIMALIDGNGRQLQELDIHYQTYGYTIDQNREFAEICDNLLDLRSLTFNHMTLSMEALSKIKNLKHLKTFRYNYSGFRTNNRYMNRGLDMIVYDHKYFDFRSLQNVVLPLQSLNLSNVELRPQMMHNWKDLFANVKHMYLKGSFVCGCSLYRYNNQCLNCLRLCFGYLSELKSLNSIDFGEPLNVMNVRYMAALQQVHFLRLNCCLIEASNYLAGVLAVFIHMADQRNGRPLVVRLYGLKCGSITRYKKFDRNLKICFQSFDGNN